jgi:hypothetical protein
VKVHEGDNGSGILLHRDFCGKCGSGLLEYGVSISPSRFYFIYTTFLFCFSRVIGDGFIGSSEFLFPVLKLAQLEL